MLSSNQMQRILDPALEELGLTNYEKKMYLLSLSLGPTPISAFAGHLGISRPNVYKVVLGLERRGLAVFSGRSARSRTFMVESPSQLIKKIREKRERMERLDQDVLKALPDLLGMYQQGNLPTAVRLFDSKEAWIEAFFDILRETKDDYMFFGNVDKFVAFAPAEQKRWKDERIKRNIRGRMLALPGPVAQEMKKGDEQELRETRIMESNSFETSFQLFGNRAMIWQPRTPIALLIEDQYIVSMLKAMFETIWRNAK